VGNKWIRVYWWRVACNFGYLAVNYIPEQHCRCGERTKSVPGADVAGTFECVIRRAQFFFERDGIEFHKWIDGAMERKRAHDDSCERDATQCGNHCSGYRVARNGTGDGIESGAGRRSFVATNIYDCGVSGCGGSEYEFTDVFGTVGFVDERDTVRDANEPWRNVSFDKRRDSNHGRLRPNQQLRFVIAQSRELRDFRDVHAHHYWNANRIYFDHG
jgi:hypothetical protein